MPPPRDPERHGGGRGVLSARAALALAAGLAWTAVASAAPAVLAVSSSVGTAPAPRRVVALAPSAAEILFALGAAGRVVAVSDFAASLPEAAGKTRVGGFTPDVERVVALAPDLVVVSRDGTDRAAYDRLVALRLPILVTSGRTLEGVFEDVLSVGRAIGEEPRALALVASLRSRVTAAVEAGRGARRGRPLPSAAVLIWPDPPIVAGPASFVGDLLRVAGIPNAAPPSAGEWPRVTLETVAAWNPGVLVRPETKENAAAFARGLSDPRWRLVPAAAKGRVLTLPGDWLERPGPRLVDALESLLSRLSAPGFLP